ncbi:MAG: hypothetical protein FJ104_02530, partial [Deltaproteobacteria bacterium]|nr:hypothetical protein [Deltaproteobacteria bacterium]
MDDDIARSAPFDLRYLYLAGGVFDGASPCASCATSCTAAGASCANSAGCGWWGCWQWDQDPPGAYVRDFVAAVAGDGQIPMITYYEELQTSGASEGRGQVDAATSAAFMGRYLADYRFVLDQLATSTALLHLEPDFWGYVEHANEDPHSVPMAVASASSECQGFEDSAAGLARCMIAMARRVAPGVRVGLHASAWGTKIDVLANTDPSFDVAGEGRKLARFLDALGAREGDFIAIDYSDRDAGFYEQQGREAWWDATDATLPSFSQALTWTRAVGEALALPVVAWQVPVGNMSLDDTNQRYRDNRVDYFFDHMDRVAEASIAALAYGAGEGQQTNPSTDDGNLVARTNAYGRARVAPCP